MRIRSFQVECHGVVANYPPMGRYVRNNHRLVHRQILKHFDWTLITPPDVIWKRHYSSIARSYVLRNLRNVNWSSKLYDILQMMCTGVSEDGFLLRSIS